MPRKKMIWEILTIDNAVAGSYIKYGRGYNAFKGKLIQIGDEIRAIGQYKKYRNRLSFRDLNINYNNEYITEIRLYTTHTGQIVCDNNGNRIHVSIIELPENKRTKRCTNCKKRGALFTKGLCKACNLLAF